MSKKHRSTTRHQIKAPANNEFKRYLAVFQGGAPRGRWNKAHGNYGTPDGEEFATFYNSPKFSAIAVDLGSGYSVAGTEAPIKSFAEKDVLATFSILQAVGFNDNEIGHIIDKHLKKLGDA